MKICIIILLVALVIFGVLACTFYLISCDPDLQPNCIRYTFRDVLIVDHSVQQKTCTKCVSTTTICYSCGEYTCCHTICTKEITYTCYNSFALATFESNQENKTCTLRVTKDGTDKTKALDKATRKYKRGHALVHKKNFTCKNLTDFGGFAIAGLVFTCLCGALVIFGMMICARYCYLRRCYRRKAERKVTNEVDLESTAASS